MNSSEDGGLTPFEQRASQLLRDSAEQIDGTTRSRLARARAAALVQHGSPGQWLACRYLAPAGAVAAGLLAAVLLVGRHDATRVNDGMDSALYDLELLADMDAYELSQESDLEFIEWAATMGEHGT